MEKSIYHKAADNLRILAFSMVEKAKSGHPGGAMGGADFMTILYSDYLVFDPEDMNWAFRDRFYLDPGHMSAMLYAQMRFFGKYSDEEIQNFRQWGSPTPGHPEIDIDKGIENTSGPLGLGHAFGAGSAIAERFIKARYGAFADHKTYIYISDGGIQEEVSQGVGRIAGHLNLGNIIMFYDANDIQLSTEVDAVTSEDTAAKYKAWGWHVITIEGNNHEQIRKALDESIAETNRPSLIIGKTIMGYGARTEDGGSHEGKVDTHGQPLSKTATSVPDTIKHLGGKPNTPFAILDDVQAHYAEVIKQKTAQAAERRKLQEDWAAENAELNAQLIDELAGKRKEIDWANIEQKAGVATRNSSGTVLAHLANEVPNMIVSSADLCNSDKTQSFLNNTKELTGSDFTGKFLQAGVSELTMAALCVGISLHGGVISACATFFAFSDYMKPVLRVAALMETPTIFLWTHDSFRVGEDGPTHQPIEQEAQLRLLEKLQNHSHRNAFLVLRPGDANETTHAWRLAYENTDTPSGLIFTRQNVALLPDSTYANMEKVAKGAYVVSEDADSQVTLLASGSEVSTLCGAADILRAEGYKLKIVSVPSEGLFRSQSSDYQTEVLGADEKKFGLTAGLSINLEGLVGQNGYVKGVNHFGYSAPANVLDDKFGINPEAAAEEIKKFLA